jgi:hypothetical protein
MSVSKKFLTSSVPALQLGIKDKCLGRPLDVGFGPGFEYMNE